jgi:hypothetical protein
MNFYITDWQTYFKPIQDRGIKVLLALVPNDDGACVGNLFESKTWTEALQEQYGDYPFNPQETYRMIDELAELMREYPIDGIAFEDEYIGQWAAPDGNNKYAFASNSANILRFCYELEQAAGRPIIYENDDLYNNSGGITESAAFTDRKGKEVTVLRNDIIDYCFSPVYGKWNPNPASAGFPLNRYSPVAVAVADVNLSAPKPPYEAPGIRAMMKQHLYGGYGVVHYYCLRSRDELRDGIPIFGKSPFFQDMFGPGNAGKPEAYFSLISETLHGQKTVYRGEDYPRRFRFA